MANQKISQLTNGNPAAIGDELPINRSGANFKITAGSVAALAPVATVFGRTGAVAATSGDYTAAQVTGAEATANKDAANGYAGLDASALTKISEFPQTVFNGLNGTILPTSKIVPIALTTLGSGDNDIYTVPAGKRALLHLTALNTTGTASISIFQEVKVSGDSTYYRIQAAVAITNTQGTNAAIAFTGFNTIILEAGDTFALNTTATGLIVSGYAQTFDVSEALQSPRVKVLSNGDNTVYTCPVGKVAIALNISAATENTLMRVFNGTATARQYTWNRVPSGGSPSASNIIQRTAAAGVATLTGYNPNVAFLALSAGDFLSVNTDSGNAGQFAYVPNLIEIPA